MSIWEWKPARQGGKTLAPARPGGAAQHDAAGKTTVVFGQYFIVLTCRIVYR
jgi:hypothetical protein